jgi:hypothetical protein
MIYESHYWKDDLLKSAKALKRKINQKRWSQASSSKLEKILLYGFYAVRKLIEAKKLSQAVSETKMPTKTYGWKGKNVNILNWLKIDELYDFDREIEIIKPVLFYCHQFVHSYILIEAFDEDKFLVGIYFSSEKDRHKMLYYLEINQIIDLFVLIGEDYPSNFSLIYNKNIFDYDIVDNDQA